MNVTEHSDLTVTFSIQTQVEFSDLSWCFIGTDNRSSCCICDNDYLNISGAGNCSHKDWKLTSHYGKGCSFEYGCSIKIAKISRKRYNGGLLQSRSWIRGLPQFSKNITNYYIHVMPSDKGTNIAYYQVIGCGVFVSLVVVGAVAFLAYALKKRSIKVIKWRRDGYEEITSPG